MSGSSTTIDFETKIDPSEILNSFVPYYIEIYLTPQYLVTFQALLRDNPP